MVAFAQWNVVICNNKISLALPLLLVWLLGLSCLGAGEAHAEPGRLVRELDKLEPLVWRDPWTARQKLRELRPELKSAGSDERALYYLRLSLALLYIYLDDEYTEAVQSGMAAVGEATPADTRLFLLTLDAVRMRREGDYNKALDALSAVVVEAREMGLGFIAVFALAEQAFTRSMAGEDELAFAELQGAYASAVAQQDEFLVALVNESFGALYGYINEYQQSIEHYQKALDAYARLGYKIYEAEATYGFAISYRYAQQWDKALAAFRRYRELTEPKHSDHGTFTAHYGLGMTYAEMGECENALENIALALDTPGPRDFKAELYKRRAVCLATLGHYPQAREAIASAREIFDQLEELKGTRWELEVLKAESKVEAAAGNMGRAYSLLSSYHEQILAWQRKVSSERLMTLRVEMENARKDHEIQLLREQSRVDALKLAQGESEYRVQRWVTIFWVTISVVVVAVLVLQLRNMRRFRELSTRDGLTGLYNRRFIFQHMEKLSRTLPLDRGGLSIVLIDVDDFKGVNDRHGHPAGDAILETMARIGCKLLRPGDEMARVGGEEFLCVLPRTGPEAASAVAQRLLEQIRNHHFPLPDGSTLQVTVSIGIASYGPGCRDAQSLYAAADHAMYCAKSGGKDKIDTAGKGT